jgi:uncharacterized protein YabE (DUF348 family)
MHKLKQWFHELPTAGKVTTVSVIALLVFGAVSVAAEPSNTSPAPSASIQKTSKPSAPKIEIKPVATTEPIPFTSSTIQDSSLEQGSTQTKTKGVNGVLTHTFQVTYTNGVETSRSKPTDSITTAPINEVIAIGTEAPAASVAPAPCPNGTYVNSAGNTVCSPYTSNTTPSGATAQCGDGSYSFSQSRSGTCSHHGGVVTWL